MDKETARYIKNYFSRLMTDDERLALKYHMYTYKTDMGYRDMSRTRPTTRWWGATTSGS